MSDGTKLSDTQTPTDSGEGSIEQDLKLMLSALAFERGSHLEGGASEQSLFKGIIDFPEGNTTAQYDREDPNSDPYGIQRMFSRSVEICLVMDTEKMGFLKQQPNEPQTEPQTASSLGQSVYQLQIVHAKRSSKGTLVRVRFPGTAIFIGKGLFLTSAHNLLRFSVWEPKKRELSVIDVSNVKHQVEPAGFMDQKLAENEFIPEGHSIQATMDIALLRVCGRQVPPVDSRAANPCIIISGRDRKWDDKLELQFCGVNSKEGITKKMKDRYPVISQHDLQKALDDLQPGKVSTAKGNGSFAVMDSSGKLENSSDSEADFITYNISTTGGASGSAIATDS